MSLKGETPADKSRIKIQVDSKWITLINNTVVDKEKNLVK
jgi:hypothetical protein